MIHIVSPRGFGKTTALLRWFILGHPISERPGWDRVLCATDATAIVPTKVLLLRMWQREGMPGSPPYDAIISAQEMFSPNYLRGRTHALREILKHGLDDVDMYRSIEPHKWEEFTAMATVDVLTRVGLPVPFLQHEVTPSRFITMMDLAATEEKT